MKKLLPENQSSRGNDGSSGEESYGLGVGSSPEEIPVDRPASGEDVDRHVIVFRIIQMVEKISRKNDVRKVGNTTVRRELPYSLSEEYVPERRSLPAGNERHAIAIEICDHFDCLAEHAKRFRRLIGQFDSHGKRRYLCHGSRGPNTIDRPTQYNWHRTESENANEREFHHKRANIPPIVYFLTENRRDCVLTEPSANFTRSSTV